MINHYSNYLTIIKLLEPPIATGGFRWPQNLRVALPLLAALRAPAERRRGAEGRRADAGGDGPSRGVVPAVVIKQYQPMVINHQFYEG